MADRVPLTEEDLEDFMVGAARRESRAQRRQKAQSQVMQHPFWLELDEYLTHLEGLGYKRKVRRVRASFRWLFAIAVKLEEK